MKIWELNPFPAFVFGEGIKETDFYSQAQTLFEEKNGKFLLNAGQLGLPAGKYVDLPEIGENDIKIGSDEAPVKVVEFVDFQCPYCKAFHETTGKILEEYGDDKVQYVYKHLPLTSIHPQANNAALAVECANEQGEVMNYADVLFGNQNSWGQAQGIQMFKNYARQLGLDAGKFNKCLDDQKYKDKVTSDAVEAQEFGISGTPAVFINDNFKGGAAGFEEVKNIIDEELE